MDFSNIFSSGKKNTVYLSVTPGVGLELIEIDTHAKVVKNYAYRPLEYNDSLFHQALIFLTIVSIL